MAEVIDLDMEETKTNEIAPKAQFSSVQELVYSRVCAFINVDHEGRHNIPPSNLNLLLDLQDDATELHKHLPHQGTKKNYVTRAQILKLINKVKSHNGTKERCSRITVRVKERKYLKLFYEVWKWIQTNEETVLRERIEAFGNPKLLKLLESRIPKEIEEFLTTFQEERKLSNFEIGKVRTMLEEHLKDYNFL